MIPRVNDENLAKSPSSSRRFCILPIVSDRAAEL